MSTLPIETDCKAVQAKMQEGKRFVLIDCREREEHNLVSIPGAILIPMSEIASRMGEVEIFRHHDLAVHCHHGGRSLRVAHWLREQGYPQAQSMAGGIDQCAQDIDPSLPRY